MEAYRLMGYPTQQREQLEKFNFLTRGVLVGGSLIILVPLLGYLLYVKKYFRRPQPDLVGSSR